jgi:hypothetical protein
VSAGRLRLPEHAAAAAKLIPGTLGCWEATICACLLVRRLVPVALVMLLCHLPATALPLVLLPEECFTRFPHGLTLEGQYIMKNLILASAVLVLVARQVERKQPTAVTE